jgi:hypothetical protein
LHALVIASRFGMLLGLSLWLGLGVALLLTLPVLEKQLPPPEARQLAAVLNLRFDKLLFLALLLVVVSLGARVSLDRTAPPTSLIAPVAAMTLCRLLLAFFRPLGARGLLLTLEVCLCLYALLAVS